MNRDQVLEIFRQTNALLEGHFLLTSGLHSPQYFQCARVLQYPEQCEVLCKDLVEAFQDETIDTVISPAIGGLVVGQEVARLIGARAIFAERENGRMSLRRGFTLEEGERVLVVEDVVTTGGSVQEVLALCREHKADIRGVGFIVDRSSGQVNFNVPKQASVLEMDVVTYSPDTCPLCRQGIQLVKPGSRNLKTK
jgi:orotate phosphoribosyltransferase